MTEVVVMMICFLIYGALITRSISQTLSLNKNRNSAIADKPRDAFRGQSRSPNIVPFHMLSMVSYYCARVTYLSEIFDFKYAVTLKPG